MQNVILKLAFCRRRSPEFASCRCSLTESCFLSPTNVQPNKSKKREDARVSPRAYFPIMDETRRSRKPTYSHNRTINQFQVGFNPIFSFILPYGDATCESAKLGIAGSKLGIRLRPLHRSALNFKSVHEILCELRIDLNYGPDFINTTSH
jgi:hypothetical protein